MDGENDIGNCAKKRVADEMANSGCNTAACEYDKGDCPR